MINKTLNVAITAFIETLKEHLPKLGDIPKPEISNIVSEPSVQMAIHLGKSLSMGFSPSANDKPDLLKKTPDSRRLLTIFEQLRSDDKNASPSISWCYPMKPVSAQNIFPEKSPNIGSDNDFCKEFKHKIGELKFGDQKSEQWFENFESLVMLYLSAVPAIVPSGDISDISLYDHCKISCAIATAAWLYHAHEPMVTEESFYKPDDQKFLFITGGITGIQSFIFRGYGESRTYRSKLLRGRSFAVSLFSELAADMICRNAGLPFSSVIMNSAGRFAIIAPNTTKVREAVGNAENKINHWLIKKTFGETSITLSLQEASAERFIAGNFLSLWEDIEKKKEEKKYQRIDLNQHGGKIGDYLDSFRNDLNPPLCPICGKRPSDPEASKSKKTEQERAICRMCRDHIFIGAELVKGSKLAILRVEDCPAGKENALFDPIFDEYQLVFPENGKDTTQSLRYWDLSNEPKGDTAVRFINGYVPKCEDQDVEAAKSLTPSQQKDRAVVKGAPKTLNLIASEALSKKDDSQTQQGLEALGVLKADVDNLGTLMACGIPKERFVLSRFSTLSRQLHYFFAVYLPYLLEHGEENKPPDQFRNIYTVFAGGDDLFLIGPWNRIIELSVRLYQKFQDYVCHNPDVHFSAGISLHKPHTPIDIMAESAEEELEKSKKEDKNRLTLFSETVLWKDVEELMNIRTKLDAWMNDKTINNAMLFRLNELMKMAAEEKRLTDKSIWTYQDMSCAKWRSLLKYTVARNAAKESDGEEKIKKIELVAEKLSHWIESYDSKLKIPVWQILYDRR